jgi:hypothetical protein
VSGARVTPIDGIVTTASSYGSMRLTKITTRSYINGSFDSTNGTDGGEEIMGEIGIRYNVVG